MTTPPPNVAVTVQIGDLTSQLKVTITSRIDNTFGRLHRCPEHDHHPHGNGGLQGAGPHGQPLQHLRQRAERGSEARVRPLPPEPPWAAVPSPTAHGTRRSGGCEGPETGKVQGDRYQTRNCETTGVDGCTGTTNNEYGPGVRDVDDGVRLHFVGEGSARGGQHAHQPADLRPDHARTPGRRCEHLPGVEQLPVRTATPTPGSRTPTRRTGTATTGGAPPRSAPATATRATAQGRRPSTP